MVEPGDPKEGWPGVPASLRLARSQPLSRANEDEREPDKLERALDTNAGAKVVVEERVDLVQ